MAAIYFQAPSVGSGNVVTLEGAQDATNFKPSPSLEIQSFGNSPGTSISLATGTMWCAPVTASTMRFRDSTYVSGTVTIYATPKRTPCPYGVGLTSVTASGSGLLVSEGTRSSGGGAAVKIATGASGTGKSGACQLYSYDFLNTTASIRYLHIYNKTTAGIPGTDTSIYVVPLAANGAKVLAPPAAVTIGSTGCSWAITTDAAGATIASSGDVTGSFTTN